MDGIDTSTLAQSQQAYLWRTSSSHLVNLPPMGIGERVKKARERRGLNLSELAKAANVKYQAIQQLESGQSRTTRHLLAIARALKVRPEWLESETGAMESADPLTLVPEKSQNRMAPIEEIDVTVSAGAGATVEDAQIVRTWLLPREVVSVSTDSPLDRIKILRVKGDSMTPTYNPLDRILVDTGDTVPSPGGVFVVWDGLGLVVKRVQVLPHSEPIIVKITSDNPKFDPYERILGEAYIQGRVIGKWLWT